MSKTILAIRTLIGILISIVALYFEKASGMRSIYLMLLLMGFTTFPMFRYWSKKNRLYFVECAIVFALNYMTRFNLNLVFIMFYMMLILECFFSYSRDKVLEVGFLSVVLMGVNFYLILPYGVNYKLITEMIFLELVLIFVVTTLYYVKSFWSEQKRVELLLEENRQKRADLEELLYTVSEQKEHFESAQEEVIRLTKIAERAEVASALHDTIGHEITGLIMQIEMLNMQYKDPLAKEAADHAREILRGMRQIVETLQVSAVSESVMMKLKQKITAFTDQTQIKVHFEFEINIDILEEAYRQMIYRTVLEALTNTAKHSNATDVWLMFNKMASGEYFLKIIDNGKSTKQNEAHNMDLPKTYEEGNGLRFIKKRVQKLGGSADCQYDKNEGFQIVVKFGGGNYD